MRYAFCLNFDPLIGLLLFAGSVYAYTIVLAPTVLEGDKALFQYTPYVLGVTYPTGFPFYLLLGKLWLLLFPFGEIAWRMNLLSALCAAAALPLLYGALRRLLESRWAALVAVLTFATLPTFWHWATVAKTYPLNILLLASVLYLLSLALNKQKSLGSTPYATRNTSIFRAAYDISPLAIPTGLLGLQISVHNTAILLVPGLLLLAWLNFRQYLLDKKLALLHAFLFLAPLLFYLYIPLRAEGLIAHYGRQEAIQRGLLADFYQTGQAGLVDYFLAAKFTGGIVSNWGLIPERFATVYVPLLADNFTLMGIGLGIIGGLALAILRPRMFWPLFFIYIVPIPFVLTYDQGEQSAFLLPSFLMFSIFLGGIVNLVERLLATQISPSPSGLWPLVSRLLPALVFFTLIPFLYLPQIRYNYNWLEAKWNRAIYDEWADVLEHPLAEGAAMLAHWGDLTPFWYMQYAQNRRPDLRGLYPPTEEIVREWFATGGQNLYLAGPLQGWASGVQERYQLIPWGRLVRLAPRHIAPQTLLPSLPPVEVTFKPAATNPAKLRLLGVDYPPQASGGSDCAVTLTWQALADLPPETTVSLRLSQGDTIVAQLDDTLLSGWFPSETLPVGQHVLSYAPIPIPLGTLPRSYRLQLVVYTYYKEPWLASQGTTVLDLGNVEIISPPTNYKLTSPKAMLPQHDFNGEIELTDYDYSVRRVGQGKGFALKLLWRAKQQPADNYTLLVEMVDAEGNILRAVAHRPVDGQAPTATWQTGQFVRDQIDLVVPASTPVGTKGLRVRLSWLWPDGSKLNLRRWFLPLGDSLDLDWLAITEKEGRVFAAPPVQYPIHANLGNKVRLIGYNVAATPEPGLSTRIFKQQISQQACTANPDSCHIHFDFYWQGLREMEEPYLVFLHVVDEQGQIVTQHDRAPGQRAKQPTTGWLPGEVVADPIDIQLPPNTVPGQYSIYVGMYLPPEGPRLPVLDNQGQAGADFVKVGVITVIP